MGQTWAGFADFTVKSILCVAAMPCPLIGDTGDGNTILEIGATVGAATV